MALNRCKCGGTALNVGTGLIDRYGCTKCDYATSEYFDGASYAIDEWNKANPTGDQIRDISVLEMMKQVYGEYDQFLGVPISYRFVAKPVEPATMTLDLETDPMPNFPAPTVPTADAVRADNALRSAIALLSALSSDPVAKVAVEELQFVQKMLREK